MPRARLPQIQSIDAGSFEPSRKNPITLRKDEGLEDFFKPIQIGGKNTALELSNNSIRVSGNLLADRIEGDVNINNGNLNIDEGFRLRFDSESEVAGLQSGNSSIHVENDEMHFTVGGVTLLKLKENLGLGTADDDQITTFGSHISLDEGFKLYFEGMDSDSYLTRTTSDVFEFYGDNVKLLSIKDDGDVVIEAGKLILENGEYISNATDSSIIFSTNLNAEMARIDTVGIDLPALRYLTFDGSGGHTNIRESADDVLTFTVGNISLFEMRNLSDVAYAGVDSGGRITFDMGTLHTYITESSNDVLDIYVGGDKILSIDESVDSGVTSLIGTLKIAEQASASADTTAYGQLWVKNDTPNNLYFTNDAGNDVQITNGSSLAGGGASALNDLSDVSYSGGDLTISSLDTILASGDLEFFITGSIALDSDSGVINFRDDGDIFGVMTNASSKSSFILYEAGGASTDDFFTISCSGNGETTISTVDAGATAAHLNIEVDGHVEFDGCGVGFDLVTPTYNAADTTVDFRTGNKQFLTFGAGNIADLNLLFPATSGNFILLLKQDGTGSRTIAADGYLVFEYDGTAASGSSTVKFAGGSNPTLTTDANHVDIISFFWDADNQICYGVASLDFQF